MSQPLWCFPYIYPYSGSFSYSIRVPLSLGNENFYYATLIPRVGEWKCYAAASCFRWRCQLIGTFYYSSEWLASWQNQNPHSIGVTPSGNEGYVLTVSFSVTIIKWIFIYLTLYWKKWFIANCCKQFIKAEFKQSKFFIYFFKMQLITFFSVLVIKK